MPSNYANYVTGSDAAGRVIEDVASAQKSVVAVLVGIAQERGYLKIEHSVSQYLDVGWSNATVNEEGAISIKQLLSINSGLTNDLSFDAEPGSNRRLKPPCEMLMAYTSARR